MSIFYLFCVGKDWNSIEETARNVMDKRWLSNQKQKIKKFNEPHGHNFEAVAHFKQYADQRDPFYIYTMNDRRGNPNKSSYVFKSSKLKAQFALNMDCTSSEKVKRCRGLVSLTASVYHPILKKLISLATMECEGENGAVVLGMF